MVDVELYGGKRGYAEHLRVRTLYALGAYRNVRDVDWTDVRRLAFVCKGNICRSPYASAVARILGAPSVSFGLDALEGAPADPVAYRNALARGVDLSGHRSTRLESSGIAKGDLFIVFEPRQLTEILQRSTHRLPSFSLLGIWARPIRPHIEDPYGRSDRYFQQCFSVIEANVVELVRRMERRGASLGGDHKSKCLSGESVPQNACNMTIA